MPRKMKIIKREGRYCLCELFILDENGGLVSVGFGVFDDSGKFIEHCATVEQGIRRLNELATPPNDCTPSSETLCKTN